MTFPTCTIGDTEIQFVPSTTTQTIRIAATPLGTHLAYLLGAPQRDGAFWTLEHSPEVDQIIRDLIDTLIIARYSHPLLMQLRLELE
jgi:hypothetical protein